MTEHTNVNYPPPPPYPATQRVEPLEKPSLGLQGEPVLEIAARVFFQGAMARSPWLQNYVDLVQTAESEREVGFALGQLAHLGSRCAHEYEIRAAKDAQDLETAKRFENVNAQPQTGSAELMRMLTEMVERFMPKG